MIRHADRFLFRPILVRLGDWQCWQLHEGSGSAFCGSRLWEGQNYSVNIYITFHFFCSSIFFFKSSPIWLQTGSSVSGTIFCQAQEADRGYFWKVIMTSYRMNIKMCFHLDLAGREWPLSVTVWVDCLVFTFFSNKLRIGRIGTSTSLSHSILPGGVLWFNSIPMQGGAFQFS